MKPKFIPALAAVLLCTALSAPASAALEANSFPRITLLSGPSGNYPPVAYVDRGSEVTVHGCLNTGEWCEVSAQAEAGVERGWVAKSDIRGFADNREVSMIRQGDLRNVPVVSYDEKPYWDRHYRDRDFYSPNGLEKKESPWWNIFD